MEWKTKCMEHNIIPNVARVVIDGGVLDIHFLNKFLRLFHSTRVRILPHSPSKNIETHACGMYATSMDHILFTLPCCALVVHTKSTF
jgi:hypothetical protein